MKNSHKNSPLARFHENLAGKRHWNLQELAFAVQASALAAEKAIGKAQPQRSSDNYVVAMLYGTRQMPHRWRVATAKALEMPLTEYERQKALITPTRAEPLPCNLHLPIDFWPHFTWRSKFTPPRKIAGRLYGLSKNGVTPSFSIVSGLWQAPTGCSDYFHLRNEAWQELVANYSRMKKEPPNPRAVWHVLKITAVVNSSIALEIMHADYRDILVTATQQGLERAIQTPFGTKRTVRQWLASSWKTGNPSEPVLPGSRHLVVNLMVLTKDGSVVLARQGPDSPESAGSWTTSVSTVVNPKTDGDSSEKPDLARAASRGCKEELNMETDGTSVRWLAMSAGLKLGSHTFFGLLETTWSRQEIQNAVTENVERARRNPTHACQVVEVEFLDMSARAVAQRLKSHDYRPYLELGLALLLWRNGDAEIMEGVEKPFQIGI